MEPDAAIAALSALAQPTRLEAVRLLVRNLPKGLPAGDIAQAVGAPANTMSAHLAVLARAGLVSAERRSRSIIYRVELSQIQALTLFLLKDCCQGRAEICGPLISELAAC